MALREWYRNVRCHFVRDRFDQSVLEGGVDNLTLILDERIKRLGELAGKMEYSFQWLSENGDSYEVITAQKRFHSAWPELESKLKEELIAQDIQSRDMLMGALSGDDYIACIKSLPPTIREAGRAWLQSIVDGIEQFLGAH
jgi:hypothetical protein